MATIENSIQRVRDFMAINRWTRYKMAREAKLSPNCLRDLSLPSWNPTVDTLRKIEAVIDEQEGKISAEYEGQATAKVEGD